MLPPFPLLIHATSYQTATERRLLPLSESVFGTALPCVSVDDVRARVVFHGSLDIRSKGQGRVVARTPRLHIHYSGFYAELPVFRHDFQPQSGE